MMTALEWLAAKKGSGGLNFVSPLPRRMWCGLNPFSEGDGGHSLSGTSLGVDTISGYLAVRVMRNPLASASCNALVFDSGWCSPHAFWTDDERGGDTGQCRSDAGCRNAIHPASIRPNVGGCDPENAAVISGGSSAAGTVQRR